MIKKVLATGVFDILHPGHIYYLEESKKLGDELVVLITCDKVASQQKRQPVLNQKERQALINNLNFVDEVVIGNEDLDYVRTINEIKPDIIALGFDQQLEPNQVDDIQLKANFRGQIIKIKKHPKLDLSTSIIIDGIKSNANQRSK